MRSVNYSESVTASSMRAIGRALRFVLCATLVIMVTNCGSNIPDDPVIPIPDPVTPELRADFNGDGYDDLLVGVPGETVGDIIAVYVIIC